MADAATLESPQTFDRILGQRRPIETLRGAIGAERIHHAWVFAGPMGVGKFTTARAFASILLDPTAAPNLAGEIEPDPDSQTQHLIRVGAHPDLHVITKELAAVSDESTLRTRKQRTIPIDLLRERMLGGRMPSGRFVESVAWKAPQLGHAKVFIVDEAELLAREGQNALLKTLEEPPRDSYIILVTTAEEKLLPTIRSRCQRLAFAPLGPKAMGAWFERADLDISAHERAWLEGFAHGSPGRALLAVETGILQWATTLEPLLKHIERGEYPVEFAPTVAAMLDEWATGWVTRHERAGKGIKPSKEAANHAAAGHLFTLLSDWAATRIREGATHHAPDLERRLRAAETIATAERQLVSNVNTLLAIDNLAAQLARP